MQMSDLIRRKATICIPNYKTLDLTRLCLRSIRKFTNYPYEVIVVDNDSRDESLEYLRSVKWIRLIEQKSDDGKLIGSLAEGSALDIGVRECKTEYYIAMHSDTFVKRENWLCELIKYFERDEDVVCVGSGKIEMIPKWRIALKKATDLRTFRRKLLRTPDPVGKFRYYNLTVCCVYRPDILLRENLSFNMGRNEGLTAGKKLYLELVDRGYKTVELSPAIMGQYIAHLAHATQVVNRNEFALKKQTIRKCGRLIDRVMSSDLIQNVMTDSSLDN
jgi:glycosyltransferase involved in cell wall biosynthesis